MNTNLYNKGIEVIKLTQIEGFNTHTKASFNQHISSIKYI